MGKPNARAAALIPYVAVALGMYAGHSAWAALGLYHLGMIAFLALHGTGKSPQGGSHIKWYRLPLITAVFAMGGVLLYAVWPLLGRDGDVVTGRLAVFGVTPTNWPYLAVYFCLANAALEELFWRGRMGSDSRLLTSNDMFFGGYHSLVMIGFAKPIWTAPVFIACTFGGWLWRRLRTMSSGLLLPVLTHVAADASIIIAVHLRAFR